MSKQDEDAQPPPIQNEESYREPEDWDLPPTITDDDECPEILENVEPEEAIGTLFNNLDISTTVSLVGGLVVAIIFYVLARVRPQTNAIAMMFIGFGAGILLVFGAAELIILGVKGMQDKLNFNPYLGGILQAIGAALAELVILIFLLIRSKQLSLSEDPIEVAHGANLAITAITLILATVIINIFFLGLSMIYAAKDSPFELPKELTFFEANLILGMMVFSFVIMIYGLYTEFTSEVPLISSSFDRGFEILIGLALILVYFIFLFVLIRNYGKKTSTPQTLIIEFFPDSDEVIIEEASTTKFIQSRIAIPKNKNSKKLTLKEKSDDCEVEEKGSNNKRMNKIRREDALATLRRFPWYIIIVLFIIGAGGIVWGGQILSTSIESGIEIFSEVPVLVYSVLVGLASSSPELIVTFRGLLKEDHEQKEVGLVHQVSAINQTFFILFGVPFVLSGIMNIGIPVALEITIIMGGIFIMSIAVLIMVMDDNKFDLLEGVVITILATVSLLALTLIGGIATEGESVNIATQLVKIAELKIL